MKNCSRHANLSVHLFARAITREVRHQKCEYLNTHNFLIDYCRDFSDILHICTRPQVDSLVCEYQPGSVLIFFIILIFYALKFMKSCTKSLIFSLTIAGISLLSC